MNKEKFEKYLNEHNKLISKDNIYQIIFLTLAANIAIYCIFKNIIATVISAIIFVIFSYILIRNRRYLREHYIYLPTRTFITGYWFWILSVFLFLLQQKHKIDFLFYILESVLLIVSFILAKRSIYKIFIKEEFIIKQNHYENDPKSYKKAPRLAGALGLIAYIVFRIIFPPGSLSETIIWYILSTLIFIFVLFSSWIFSLSLLMYTSYLKCFKTE